MFIKIKQFIVKDLNLGRNDWLAMAIFVVALVALVCSTITKYAFWADEAFSSYMTQFSFFDIAKLTTLDVHSPIYYWSLKLWASVFGSFELGLRSFSLLFGCLSVIFLYVLIKFIFNRRAACFSSAVLIISPVFIRYCQETRMYSMMLLFAILATLAFVIADRKKDKKSLWITYGIISGLGILVHYMFLLIIISHWVWRILDIRYISKEGNYFSTGFKASIWSMFYTILLWLPFALCQFFLIQSNGFWPVSFHIKNITDFFSNTVLFMTSENMPFYVWAYFIIVLFCIIFLLKKYFQNSKDNKYALLIACICFVPLILLTILSSPPFKPIFINRYLICSSVFLKIMIAVSISRFKITDKDKLIAGGLVVIALLFGVYNVGYYKNSSYDDQRNTNIRDLMADINKSGNKAPIITNSYGIYYEVYYYANDKSKIYFVNRAVDEVMGSYAPVRNNQNKINSLDDAQKKFKYFWYVVPIYSDDTIENTPRPRMTWIPKTTIQKYDKNINDEGFRATLFEVVNL